MRRAFLVAAIWCACVFTIGCGGGSAASTDANAPRPLKPVGEGSESSESAAQAEPTDDVAVPEGVTPCEHLVTRLCDALGTESITCKLVRDNTVDYEMARCKLMLVHYDEVLADLQRYAAEHAPLSADKVTRALSGAVATHGPDNAPVTIILFSDFQCPFCLGAAEATRAVMTRYPDRVRVIFRQFPLSFHEHAHVAAEAALAAAAQGKFWEMHDQLFAHQGALERAALSRYAKEIGLDTAAFDAAIDTHTFAAAVDSDFALGVDLGVSGTPTMFLNGERVPDPRDADSISARIDAALQPALPAR